MKQALNILIGYLTCTDPIIQNKWLNLLSSFWHKDEGNLIKDVQSTEGGYNVTVIHPDGSDTIFFIEIPTLPNSQPISFINGLQPALDNKVDKAIGKALSSNDFTTSLKNKLETLENYLHPEFHQIADIEGLQLILNQLDDKVDKVDGKGLSENDFTNDYKTTLDGLIADEILITDPSQIANQLLFSNRAYKFPSKVTFSATDNIIVPPDGLTIVGNGFNTSGLYSTEDNHNLFISEVDGSGDLILQGLTISVSGVGSKVFDIEDADGNSAVEFEYVNFSGCTSLGEISGYRQGTFTTVGVYGCLDGLLLSGAWNGFKISNTNVFGTSGTLFKSDASTSFSNRFFLNVNGAFATGGVLLDFDDTIFLSNELLQINSSIAKYNDVLDINNGVIIIPNISANNPKCLWVGNIGLPDTATDVLVEKNDLAAAYELDWLKDTFFLEMTDNTTFTEKNLPASGKNTQQITLYLTGEFEPTFPAAWYNNFVGTYKGADVNEISITFIKTGVYFVKISNSLSVYPAPILGSINPVSLLPNSTSELVIGGSFYTPAGFVLLDGQVVNSIEFDPDTGNYILSVTTGALEGEFDITISNGTSVTFSSKLIVNLGEVFIPTESDWLSTTGNPFLEDIGEFKITIYNNTTTGIWDKVLDYTKDFIVEFKAEQSPLGLFVDNVSQQKSVALLKASNNSELFGYNISYAAANNTYTTYLWRRVQSLSCMALHVLV